MMMRAVAAAVAIGLFACGGTKPARAPAPVTPAKAAPAPEEPAPSTPAPSDDPLNLGFERGDGELPAGWLAGAGVIESEAGATVRRDSTAHGGARSMMVAVPDRVRFAAFHRELTPSTVRGQHVRFAAWVKTRTDAAAAGGTGLWIHVTSPGSPGGIAYVDGSTSGPRGVNDWTETEVELEIPADATRVVIGGLLFTQGQAWFDDLVVEVTPIDMPIEIAGVVRDAAGAPVGGAEVALIGLDADANDWRIIGHLATAADGSYRFGARAGHYGISVHKPGVGGAFVAERRYRATAGGVDLTLPGSGTAVDGRVKVRGGSLRAGLYLRISPTSPHHADQFAVAVGPDGRFSATLPVGTAYGIYALADDLVGFTRVRTADGKASGELVLDVVEPAPAEVGAWIEANALVPASLDVAAPDADLARFGTMIGKARVVAIGEAAYGTLEYTQLRLRLFAYLVAHHGFTMLAIEASPVTVRTLNEYVVTGAGDPRAALEGLVFWNWRTAEMLRVVEWMRAWNADPSHRTRIELVGIDSRLLQPAATSVASYLTAVAPDDAVWFAPLATLRVTEPREVTPLMVTTADKLAALFDENRATWRKAGAVAYDVARQDLEELRQALRYRIESVTETGHNRAATLAGNLRGQLARAPRAKAVVWAHDEHVGVTAAPAETMGHHLRRAFGTQYVAAGTVFGEGSFVAENYTGRGAPYQPSAFELGAPLATDAAAPFAVTGKPLVIADLRTLPRRGVVRDWFRAEHPLRRVTWRYHGERSAQQHPALAQYDLVLYVARLSLVRRL